VRVAVSRGELVESVHEVSACIADAGGESELETGEVERPVYLRSSAKPFIAAAIVASGAADEFAFDDRELAVIAASHGGEPFHVAAVRGILSKIGLGVAALQCGAHPPSYEPAAAALAAAGEAPSALHNNCSGKHAGILAMCVCLGFDLATYAAPGHPAQRRILALCARLAGVPAGSLPLAVDGCGIPVYAVSLRAAARSFARFATLKEVADEDARPLERVRSAMRAEPRYVAGTGRFDSALIEATRGRIVGKAGAEGVHGDAFAREGLGLALKAADGARRAVAPAVVALAGSVGALDPGEAAGLTEYAAPAIHTIAGAAVGRVVALSDTIPRRRSSYRCLASREGPLA
jgi:L-asparaginase II